VSWRIEGKIADIAQWSVGWHLSISRSSVIDAQTVHDLHGDLLTIADIFFRTQLAAGVTCGLSRILVTGIVTQVSDEQYLLTQGHGVEPAPCSVALAVDELVQARGPGRQGRFYLPPPPSTDVDLAFQLSPGAQAGLASNLAFLFDEINGTTSDSFPSIRFAVPHRVSNGAWLPQAVMQPVDSFRPARLLSHQIRRQRRLHAP
jgi:hypothetical protein